MEQINVKDKTITTTQVVKSVEIDSIEVKLNQSASLMVKLLDSDGRLVNIERVTMEGSDYSSWGNDDTYVTTFVLTKLGLTKA